MTFDVLSYAQRHGLDLMYSTRESAQPLNKMFVVCTPTGAAYNLQVLAGKEVGLMIVEFGILFQNPTFNLDSREDGDNLVEFE